MDITEIMVRAAVDVAQKIDANAVISFIPGVEVTEKGIEIIEVKNLQLDVLKDLTMSDILEVSERHTLDAIIQLYLRRNYTAGKVVAVFYHAIVVYDIEEGANFINLKEYEDVVSRDVLHEVLSIALEIGREGREGRQIGTAFIIGCDEEVLKRSHQAVINPYHSQPEDVRNVMDRSNRESIKEIAQLDGIFIISSEGRIIAAGRYVDTNSRPIQIDSGLGGRHRAAAAITQDLPVVGVTVSESGGIVRIFRDGVCKITIGSEVNLK